MAETQHPRRSLILAGGGIKVAFQAGVLQVWLDEAGLAFDHADGASGGCLNLVQWIQGMTGTQIADNWRNLDPNLGIDFNFPQYLKLFYASSLFTLDGYRQRVFPRWGLDFDAIRASEREATLNVYNFSRHELSVLPPAEITEDHLAASVSLPMWFPPVDIDGDRYIDAVFITDANLEEAIRRGADELWIIWTVSDRGEWRDGFVAEYFQIIEAAAFGRYKRTLERIAASNAAIERGEPGELGRPIAVRELRAEVPLHYLIDFNQDRLAEAVNRGVVAARQWCRERGIPLSEASASPCPTCIVTAPTRLRFREKMRGFLTAGETDYDRGFRQGRKKAQRRQSKVAVELAIEVPDVDRFITFPDHGATVTGKVIAEGLGGELAIDEGSFHLFVDDGDPTVKQLRYRLFFRDGEGARRTLAGFKEVRDDPGFDLWSDTTTLFTRLYGGRVEAGADDGAEVAASGILQLHLVDFLKELATFRVDGPTLADRTQALSRFGKLFLGNLWDVYARDVLSYGPF